MSKRNFYYLICLLFFFSCKKEVNPKFVPYEDLFIDKQFPSQVPNVKAMEIGLNEAKRTMSSLRSPGQWEVEGPGNIGARINSIAIHPNDENIILAGFSDGGLWKTIDGGKNWKSIFENEIYQSVGSICFDPQNPNRIYVGTGDPNISAYPRAGGGIYMSENLGDSWIYIGLKETKIISRIIIPTQNSNIIYASAMGTPFVKDKHRGVYKSIDKGKNWTQVLHVNDSCGVSEIVIDPSNPNKVYAVSWNRLRTNRKSLVAGPDAALYKSNDGGNNWIKLDNGIPKKNYSRLGFAIAPSNPKVMYLEMTSSTNFELDGIYKSNDEGATWDLFAQINNNGLPTSPLGGFGWYFGKLRVDPENENELYMLGVELFQYNPSQKSWRSVDDFSNGENLHADKHDLIIRNGNKYLATDGGLYKSMKNSNNTWEDIENIPTTQFYRTAYDPHRTNAYWGGAQDNGTSTGNKGKLNSWERIYGGDGFQMAFHPTNPNIMFATSQNGNLQISRNGGATFNNAASGIQGTRHWDMQYIISKHNPSILYSGTEQFYKGTVGTNSVSWTPISPVLINPTNIAHRKQMTSLDESSLSPDILYCGLSDGMVWNTKDGGKNWKPINKQLPERYVSSIKASPNIQNNVYITYTGYRDDEEIPYVFRSTDNGDNWTNITSNLPPIAVNDIYILKQQNDDVLFVGTDAGVYFTTNGGSSWDRLGTNMPLIPIFDMDYDIKNNKLIAATFARGIMTFDLKQVGLNLETGTTSKNLIPIQIKPNITNDYITLEGEDKTYTIINSNGKIMGKYHSTKLDVSNYPNGYYIVKTKTGQGRFIKTR
jgi:photosystem II stability/assembly factor-like uncharacterized protein